MGHGSFGKESIKQLLRTENDEIRLPGLPTSCCRATSSTQPTCIEKRSSCPQQITVRSTWHPKPSAESENRCILCCRDLEPDKAVLQSIATTSKDIFAMTIAGVCVALIHRRSSSTLANHADELWSALHRKLALAIESLERTKTWQTIANRASPLLTNPPLLLVLAAIILLAFSLSHVLHSQKSKQYRYRDHIMGIGLLGGTVVGIWKTEERVLMEGKSYLAGSAVLALLVSWVVHAVLGIGGKNR